MASAIAVQEVSPSLEICGIDETLQFTVWSCSFLEVGTTAADKAARFATTVGWKSVLEGCESRVAGYDSGLRSVEATHIITWITKAPRAALGAASAGSVVVIELATLARLARIWGSCLLLVKEQSLLRLLVKEQSLLRLLLCFSMSTETC